MQADPTTSAISQALKLKLVGNDKVADTSFRTTTSAATTTKRHHLKVSKLEPPKSKKKNKDKHLIDAESKHETLFEDKVIPDEDNVLWNHINEHGHDNLWNRISRYRDQMKQLHLPDNYKLTRKDCDPSLHSTFKGHTDAITSLDFSPDGSRLASVSYDSSLFLWKIKGNFFPLKYVHHELGGVFCVKFAPKIFNGAFTHLIATGGNDRTVRLMHLGIGDDTAEIALQRPHHSVLIKAHEGTVNDIAFDYTSQFLLSCSSDNTAKLWSLQYQQFVSCFLGHSQAPLSCDISYDGRVVATGGKDKVIKLFDSGSAKCIVDLKQHTDFVNKVRFSPDGTCLASCSKDHTIRIFDLRYSGRPLQKYDGHQFPVSSIDFHKSGNYLISTGEDNNVKIWNLMHAQLMYTISGHVGSTTCARFSMDGSLFATGGTDSSVLLWNSNFASRHAELSEIANNPHIGSRVEN
ncbi:hypothetical protein C9374_011078 [Naegleria lovaniensis]|uniref:Guanine nucleotide-binding protein subunit beta-like protein n=1 Tax=Naegleria lovaniensis TaxID=51637 RepID=A0AA88KFN6_NAELO|nr:uncharacterized protein C9374_011078 [Naegleria lovaniensis]KAG2374241.1 hypothetical protein C9374_011078 [Naegleria lovaniensis]